MSKKKIRRGDVFLADLNPVVGSEEGGTRPVLIVQNNTGNRNSRTTIVAPITRKLTSSYLPVHVIVSPSVTGLQETSSVMLEQIRVMDKERLKEKVGHQLSLFFLHGYLPRLRQAFFQDLLCCGR